MQIVRAIVALPFAMVGAGLVGALLDVSAHGPGYFIALAILWPACYWVLGHRSWFRARGNPGRHDA
jgi:hypothetical protein